MAWALHPYRLPLARPYAWAEGAPTERAGGLVTDGQGWGEIAYAPGRPFSAGQVRDMLRHADRLDALTDPRVRCGAASAQLDTAAQADHVPLARILDAHARPRSRVAVNALIVGDDVAPQVDAARAAGIRVLKIKCGADRDADVARVAAVRAADPHAVLRLDANGAWAPEWALEHMQELANHDIDYVEQPVAPKHDSHLVRIRQRAPFLVAIDESATTPHAIRRLLHAGAADVVIIKPQRLGGPDRAVEAIHLAQDEGARVVVTNSLETSVGVHVALHCASLLRHDEACGLATGSLLARDVAASPVLRDGRMAVPSQPGLGVAPEDA